MNDPPAAALDYLARLGVTGELARQLLRSVDDTEPSFVAAVQARLAQEAGGANPPAEPADADLDWLRGAVQRAYGLPVAAPQRALMPTLLPLRRQPMSARALHRGFVRQLLGMFVYRPAARVLRRLQVLTGREERP